MNVIQNPSAAAAGLDRLLVEMRPKLHRYCARMTGSVIDGELAPPAVTSGGSVHHGVDNLGGAVEAYLSSHFSGFPNGVPPPGLYHRILKEIEVPLLTAALAATRGNQIRAADLLGLNRNTLRKKIRDLDIQVYRSGN